MLLTAAAASQETDSQGQYPVRRFEPSSENDRRSSIDRSSATQSRGGM